MDYGKAWLNYNTMASVQFPYTYVVADTKDRVLKTAVAELQEAVSQLTKTTLEHQVNIAKIDTSKKKDDSIIVFEVDASLASEEYCLKADKNVLHISGGSGNGVLYGVFELIRLIQTESPNLPKLISGKVAITKKPSDPLRMLNHWDNMDGSIERGYSGLSFFFRNNEIIVDERTRYYAKLLASVGINATVINNVNVRAHATELITDKYLPKLSELADVLADYGIKLFLSLNFAAPMELGGLSNCDPLDKKVQDFWKKKMQEVYKVVPTLGGFLVKADSEGRPGPFTYGRNHADGANMLAKAIAPYGGLIIWRCFVYNCTQDWRDQKTDRARAGYDNFMPLDGKFLDNVILQIKNGPMDFQVREPVSPLFSGLEKTNQMLEVQAAQEYTGQQIHLCYLIPMWKEVLAFKTYAAKSGENDTVADIVSGNLYGNSNCGIAAVANTGNDFNWTGHDMAAANFYGFGRLAFENELSAKEIAEEWIACTFGNDEKVKATMTTMLLESWHIYESYTSPLGIGWMVNPSHHYGPNVDGYEYDRWGTYHRSDCKGMGVDRTTNGTGYTMQYREPNASMYNKPETCPEELLLFFHHIPYTYMLKTGKTLIQHIYDTHFEGAMRAQNLANAFWNLRDKLDSDVFERTMSRFKQQADSAKEWRDRINTYYFRMSGIPDNNGRTIY